MTAIPFVISKTRALLHPLPYRNLGLNDEILLWVWFEFFVNIVKSLVRASKIAFKTQTEPKIKLLNGSPKIKMAAGAKDSLALKPNSSFFDYQ